jgi:hypothetical protein
VNRRRLALSALAALSIALAFATSAQAAAPRYDIKAGWGDTDLGAPDAQGLQHKGQFYLLARNLGEATSNSAVTITDHLPPGVTIAAIEWKETRGGDEDLTSLCSGQGTETLTCTVPGAEVAHLLPAPSLGGQTSAGVVTDGYMPPIYVNVSVSPSASGAGTNTATISGGDAPTGSDVDQVPLSQTPSSFGLVPGSYEADAFDAAYPFGEPSRQAGDHPFELRVNFDLTAETGVAASPPLGSLRYTVPKGLVKDVEVTLPRGMIGNPEALPKCDPTDFASAGAYQNSTLCPADTQVGYLNVSFADGTSNRGQGAFQDLALTRVALYNLVPPKGVPADFGFDAGSFVLGHIYPELDPSQNYAIKTLTPDISSALSVRGSQVTFWGVPGDPAHDKFRYYPEEQEDGDVRGAPFTGAAIRPFLAIPMDCGFDNGGARVRADSYQHPGEFTPVEEYGNPLDVSGCEDPRFRFKPEIALQPTDTHADAPTGLSVHLQVPQRNDEVENAKELYAENGSVKSIPTPPIKKAVVTLPEGMTISPSAAQGLGSCSLQQIGLGTNTPVTCPDNSQYGTLTLHTPILPESSPPKGFIYIAKQGENPFHDFLALYLVIEEPEKGILVKIPGRVDLDPTTGQIKTTFDELPQFPVSDMELNLKGGVRAALVEPSTCGTKTIAAEFFTWQDPTTAHTVKSSYDVTEKPDGSPCVDNLGERPFKPQMEAGTVNNAGGSYSPFSFRLTRTDNDQEFSQLVVTLPPGLAARFAGVSICSDAAIAQAEARTGAGQGALEQAEPSCPASSQIGTTEVGVGVGVPLTYVPGKVYLAGPYKGAPISIVVISPAVVGPYDLGVIAVRTALDVNPITAQGSATSDPFPQIFQGIPVRIRDIRLDLDRPDFTLNPTSCAEKQIDAHITGTGGDVDTTADDTTANLTNRFQAADCASLAFKPKLGLKLFGGTKRGDFPKLRAILTYPKGGRYANVATASVALPHSEFLEQGHIKTVCTRVQFAADQCPAASIYGKAIAKTPLFSTPLEGPVYLRSSSNLLPDLVAVLKGPASQPVEIDLDGRIDSFHGGIRTTFSVVPDAPVESFKLEFQGGKKSLLVNSTNLCRSNSKATARFTAQNGAALTLRPALQNSCKKKRKAKGKPKKAKRGAAGHGSRKTASLGVDLGRLVTAF